MTLPLPPQISTDPAVNAAATAWAAQLVDAINRGGDPWRMVGAAGEPAFTNAWARYDTGGLGAFYGTVRFYKDVIGVVRIEGIVKDGVIGTGAFTLPEGYRPGQILVFDGEASDGASQRLDVSPNGIVTPSGGTGGAGFWISLSQISFRAA